MAVSLGNSGQTPGSWVKEDAAGRLTGRKAVKAASDEQMEISRLKAELARTRMERGILKKAMVYFAGESRRDAPSPKNTGRSGRPPRNAACWRSAPAASGRGASAAAGSLFGPLKGESHESHDFEARRAARSRRGIATCNATRLHPTPGYPSPMQFERKWLARTTAEAASTNAPGRRPTGAGSPLIRPKSVSFSPCGRRWRACAG